MMIAGRKTIILYQSPEYKLKGTKKQLSRLKVKYSKNVFITFLLISFHNWICISLRWLNSSFDKIKKSKKTSLWKTRYIVD